MDYAHSLKYEDIPPEVVERTKQMLLDFLGVAYGGLRVAESSAPIIRGALDFAAGAEGGSAVIGRPERLPAHYAPRRARRRDYSGRWQRPTRFQRE